MRVAILTFVILIVSVFTCEAQYLEKGRIVTDSTEYIVEDVYVQPAKEEVKQRRKINFLTKKIDKLKKLGHKKQELLVEQGNLLDTIASLEARIESLREENELLHQEMIQSCERAIDLANAKLTDLHRRVGKLRKKTKLLTIFIISESIILIIIII